MFVVPETESYPTGPQPSPVFYQCVEIKDAYKKFSRVIDPKHPVEGRSFVEEYNLALQTYLRELGWRPEMDEPPVSE